MRNSGERAYAQESRDFFLKTVSMAGLFVPVIAACSSDRSRQQVTKVDKNAGLTVVIDWEVSPPGDGLASITFRRESFARIRREGILRVVYNSIVDPNAIFIFSAGAIGSGYSFDAMFGFKNEPEARDLWEKDFYGLDTDSVNTVETRWNNTRFTAHTLNKAMFTPDSTKLNPRRVRVG